MAFSPDSLYLASSSNTETVHIFKLDAHSSASRQHQQHQQLTTDQHHSKVAMGTGGADDDGPASSGATSVSGGWMDYVSKTAANYLPTQMGDIFQQDRSFATAHLPSHGRRNVVALVKFAALLEYSRLKAAYPFNSDIALDRLCL